MTFDHVLLIDMTLCINIDTSQKWLHMKCFFPRHNFLQCRKWASFVTKIHKSQDEYRDTYKVRFVYFKSSSQSRQASHKLEKSQESRRMSRHYIRKIGHKSQDERHEVRKRASFVTKAHESQDKRHES